MTLARPTTLLLARVMATATMAGIGLSLSTPLLSLVLESEGIPRGLNGLNAASGGLGALLVAPFVGRLVRWGAARAMAAGLLLCVAVFLLLPLRVELWTWFGLRILFSAGIAVSFIMSESAINALVDDTVRARVLGLYGALFSLGYVAGPGIVAVVGSAGALPFLIGAAILLIGLLPLIGAGGIDAALRGGAATAVRLEPLRRLRQAPIVFATAALYTVLEVSHFAFLPLLGLSHGFVERDAALLLVAFIAGNIVLQYPVGWLADRLGRLRVLIGVAIVTALAHLLLGPAIASGWVVWPLLVLVGGAAGSMYSLGLAILGDAFPPAELAPANTLYVIMLQLGVLIGPALSGAVMQGIGVEAFPPTLALVTCLLPLAVVLARRRVA